MTMITASPARRPARQSAIGRLALLLSVWRQRQVLRSLDDRALTDIGVTRREAEAEASRPIWDAPETWRF